MKTPADLAAAIEYAAALLGEARQFPTGPRDAAALDVLAAALADRRVTIPPDVWEAIRSASERAGTGPDRSTADALVRVLEALQEPPARR